MFVRLVYERDAFDVMLARSLLVPMPWMLRIIPLTAQVLVWLSRAVLWLLMMLGHVFSGLLSRQMEYAADRYAVQVTGSASFEKMILALAERDVAEHEVQRSLERQWLENRLPSDIPASIARRWTKLSPKKKRNIESSLTSQTTAIFDTHPAPADRIARAVTEGANGCFQSDQPAAQLISDIDALSAQATLTYYKAIFRVRQ